MDKAKILSEVKDYLMMTLACLIFAFAWECFVIPNEMSSGGLMGLCTIIQYATNDFLSAPIMYVVINAVMILGAMAFLGIGFGFKTVFCILMSTVCFELVDKMTFLHCAPGGFFYVNEKVLVPIIAGVLEAVALGMILKRGGSTGGTDIVALIVNKYWPVAMSKVFLISDIIVVSLMLFLPDKHFADMIYGFEMLVTFSITIDMVLSGQKSSIQLMVFSDKYDQIADYIIKDLKRGVTVLKAQGWFTKKDKNVLLIVMSRKQFPTLSKAIKDMDPKAFLSVTQASSVYGEGFDEIKTGIKDKLKKDGRKESSDKC